MDDYYRGRCHLDQKDRWAAPYWKEIEDKPEIKMLVLSILCEKAIERCKELLGATFGVYGLGSGRWR